MIMNTIPLELIHEIFSRLPVKSIARCRCVSEQWKSILCSEDFTELFLTKSSTRPSLLFSMESSRNNNEFLFFSSPQLDDKSSSLAASLQFKLSKDMPLELCGHASGLFCLRRRRVPKEERDEKEEYTEHVICNPSTGQCGFLPTVRTGSKSFLGFDPIDKVFKVVSSDAPYCYNVNIFTLGTGEVKWRKIKSTLPHNPSSEGICLNGAVHYLARGYDATWYIVCFDVRSEKFKFVHADFPGVYATRLINYEGKLGLISWSRNFSLDESITMRVLEDVEKHDWSEHLFTIPGDKLRGVALPVGVTATGEIVLMKNYYHSNPFYVFYFHPERNTVKRLEVHGFENHGGGSRVYTFVDHVDDLTFNMKSWQLHQDIPRFESFNKFRALSLLDDV